MLMNGDHLSDDEDEVIVDAEEPLIFQDVTHHQNLLHSLNTMRKNRTFCDVILHVSSIFGYRRFGGLNVNGGASTSRRGLIVVAEEVRVKNEIDEIRVFNITLGGSCVLCTCVYVFNILFFFIYRHRKVARTGTIEVHIGEYVYQRRDVNFSNLDVGLIFQVGNTELYGHRAVLASVSSKLMELFSVDDEEKTTNPQGHTVQITLNLNRGFGAGTLEKVIEYAYTSRLGFGILAV